MVEVLDLIVFNGGYISHDFVKSKGLCTYELEQLDYVHCRRTQSRHITDTGRKALAAHKAQRDTDLFFAEFENWLEAEYSKACSRMVQSRIQSTEAEFAEDNLWMLVMEKYRECKKRMQS